jgi:RNA polymerase sigma-70 factor (ECF subfamily)
MSDAAQTSRDGAASGPKPRPPAEAIEQAYRAHGHSVLRRARHLLGDEADAREMVQEIFASLIERPEQFAGQSSMVTFLYAATTHACLNRLRDRRTRARLLAERVAPATPEREGPGAEAAALVRDLLEKLPEDMAMAAVYCYVDELTHEEIASIMGCSRRHVGNLLERVQAWASEEVAS